MNDDMRTYPPKKRQLLRAAEGRAEQFMQAVNAAKNALDTEERFKEVFSEMSVYFGSLETPAKNPTKQKIDETHKRTKKLAEKLCPAEENASFVAQEKALAIWNEYKNNPDVKAKYCKRDHRVSYADVFDFCKRSLREIGLKTARQFERAVKASQKRKRDA